MESAGHDPDIYHDDKAYFYFGTCSKESPQSARNCVYDEAVEMAQAKGITLMLPQHYQDILQKKGKFDNASRSWLLTQYDIRPSGDALYGVRSGEYVAVDRYNARYHNDHEGWRGALRVKKVSA